MNRPLPRATASHTPYPGRGGVRHPAPGGCLWEGGARWLKQSLLLQHAMETEVWAASSTRTADPSMLHTIYRFAATLYVRRHAPPQAASAT